MLLQLVKKDALIAKKYAIIAMIFMFVIPLFILNAAPSAPAFLRLLYTTILGELVLMQAISQEEGRCPKAASLLCTAPYRRRDIVAARYVFFLLLFVYGYAAYTLVTWIADPSGFPNLTSVLGVLLVNTVVFGIYLPIEFKYGLVKAKFIFIIFILLFSLGPSAFHNLPNIGKIIFLWTASPAVENLLMALASAMIFGLSMAISVRIFSKKDL